jgi:uncharacterized membrane protein HdeD (DUF308 family)
MSARSIAKLIKSSELAIMGAILLISFGVLGIFLSIATGLHPTILSGRLFVACGLAYLIYAFSTRNDGEAAWRILTSLLYTFAGLYLLLFFSPGLEVRNVMVVVGVVVLIESMMEFLIFYRLRARKGSGWIAAGAIATTLLVLIICGLWPVSSMRLIGGVVGAKFLISGVSRLMYSLATYKSLEAFAREQGSIA